MHPLKIKKGKGPEAPIQKAVISMLQRHGWLVRVMKADEDHVGWPDLFACHFTYGIRLIEIKLPDMKGSRFTPAQEEWFPKMEANGARIWILTSDSEAEYQKLFKASNYNYYRMMKCLGI